MAATYAVVGFVVVQVPDLVFPALHIPPWAFEMTREGVRRTPDAATQSVTRDPEAEGGERPAGPAHAGGRERASGEPAQGSAGSGGTPDQGPDRGRRAASALAARRIAAHPLREDLGKLAHAPYALVLNDLEHGRIDRAVSDIESVDLHPMLASCYLAGSMAVGLPVPDSVAAAYLEPSIPGPDASLRRLKCAGTYLVERGRGDELESLASRIREAPHNDRWPSVELDRSAESAVELLEGYRAWKAGDPEAASRQLSGTAPRDGWSGTGVIWRGDLRRDLGELERAEAWYLVAWWHPVAHQRLGRLYEQMDRPADAVEAYRRFITAWEDADEPLQLRVEDARERVADLPGGRVFN